MCDDLLHGNAYYLYPITGDYCLFLTFNNGNFTQGIYGPGFSPISTAQLADDTAATFPSSSIPGGLTSTKPSATGVYAITTDNNLQYPCKYNRDPQPTGTITLSSDYQTLTFVTGGKTFTLTYVQPTTSSPSLSTMCNYGTSGSPVDTSKYTKIGNMQIPTWLIVVTIVIVLLSIGAAFAS
jgi:hypothetical protein